MKTDSIIFKNEMGKEVMISFTEKSFEGSKGAKNVPVTYDGVIVKMASVHHNFEIHVTKKELDKLRFGGNKFLKEVGKKSTIEEK